MIELLFTPISFRFRNDAASSIFQMLRAGIFFVSKTFKGSANHSSMVFFFWLAMFFNLVLSIAWPSLDLTGDTH
jgi:hypothetical protein